MLSRFFAPLHPDGIKFVAVAALATIVLFILWAPLGWLALILTLSIAYFFRDPFRVTPTRAGLLISPADGIVLSVAVASPPSELAMEAASCTRISIFLSVLDVHVIRAPLGGRVANLMHVEGRFINASLDKASQHNERLAVRMAPPNAPELGFVMFNKKLARIIV